MITLAHNCQVLCIRGKPVNCCLYYLVQVVTTYMLWAYIVPTAAGVPSSLHQTQCITDHNDRGVALYCLVHVLP